MFAIDLPKCTIGEFVTITGYVIKKRKFPSYLSVRIKDITGTILVLLDKNVDLKKPNISQEFFHIGTRIRINGRVSTNNEGVRLLKNITDAEVLGKHNARLPELDEEMREQASRMLMSRICRNASQFLNKNKFTELETRVISRKWVEKGLEPLRVLYPGFGSNAVLSTSPSAQVMDFLSTTLVKRAFTVSTSFSTTYRFKSGPADLRVIVAKALDLSEKELQEIIWDLSIHILSKIDDRNIPSINRSSPKTAIDLKWPHTKDQLLGVGSKIKDPLTLVRYSANMVVEGENWTTEIVSILHLINNNGSILVEGATERLGDDVVISSLTVYPSQFLGFLKKAPIRQLRNIGRFNVWQ